MGGYGCWGINGGIILLGINGGDLRRRIRKKGRIWKRDLISV
jgi:hypothetical protein